MFEVVEKQQKTWQRVPSKLKSLVPSRRAYDDCSFERSPRKPDNKLSDRTAGVTANSLKRTQEEIDCTHDRASSKHDSSTNDSSTRDSSTNDSSPRDSSSCDSSSHDSPSTSLPVASKQCRLNDQQKRRRCCSHLEKIVPDPRSPLDDISDAIRGNQTLIEFICECAAKDGFIDAVVVSGTRTRTHTRMSLSMCAELLPVPPVALLSENVNFRP